MNDTMLVTYRAFSLGRMSTRKVVITSSTWEMAQELILSKARKYFFPNLDKLIPSFGSYIIPVPSENTSNIYVTIEHIDEVV